MKIPGIKHDSLSLTTHYLRMLAFEDNIMSTATGFIYEFESQLYFITNGHNITRINPTDNSRLSSSAAYPLKIRTNARIIVDDKIGTSPFEIALYKDQNHESPSWLMHPTYGYQVDVIAIPLGDLSHIPNNIKFYPINNYDFTPEYGIEVADDVFVLGYPLNLTGGKELPIWKKGTIATEPSIDIDNLPKYLIDTATRSGMSGSPVIMYRHGIHGMKDGKFSDDTILGLIQNFAGIYSGRIGAEDNFHSQLGIVWKPHVLDEIIKGKVIGNLDFQKQ